MKIEEIYLKFKESNGVSTDSRNIKKNQIFIALNGENFNGNKFAKSAISNGAKYAIIDDKDYFIENKTILVNDTLKTIQELANFHRNKFNIPVIGITGTNGKTTTKELINTVLSKKYKTVSTKGNLNNHIGVPLTLLDINDNTEIAIIEMGANHKNEINDLCNIANPNYGLITNIGKAHIEGFGTFENIIKTKTELFKYLENTDGKIIYNSDDKILKSYINKNKTFTYGIEDYNYVKGNNPKSNPFLKLKIQSINKIEYNIQTNLIGNYNFYNVLAAFCLGRIFNVSDNDIISAIENYAPTNMRSQLKKTNKNTLIIDAYNANPVSMKNAILNINNLKNKNKILILGDMLELGTISENEHTEIIKMLVEFNFNKVFLVGEIFNKINYHKKFVTYKSTNELINSNILNNIKNSFILIKGSRGIHLEKIFDLL